MHYDIVIAGGGFAGAYCARSLGRALGPEAGKRVALIAQRNVLVFQPMLAEVVGSSLAPFDVVNPLRQLCRGVSVLQGTIQKIEWANRELVLDGGPFTPDHRIGFTHLVMALGSVTDLSAIPGLSEHGRPMKDLADALRLRSALINRLEEASLARDPETRRRLLSFVVVGGGYTGVETAGQMVDFMRQACRYYYRELQETQPRIFLVHGGDELLPEIGPALGAYARRVLEKRGVAVKLGCRVESATGHGVRLQDGTAIEANTVVTTVGSSPHPLVTDLCRQLGIEARKGRIPVGPDMRVVGEKSLWGVGDCASVPWNDRGEIKTSPPTAQFAVRQGRQLAKNIIRASRGEELRPFAHRYFGQLATVGERDAVAEVMGLHFRGFVAWWLWRTIYLAKLPGGMRRLRVMIDWTFDLIFRRDISLIMPQASRSKVEPPRP